MSILFFFIFLALAGEAFFAGSETAFVSVNFLKIMHLIEKKNARAMIVHNLLKKPDRLLTTTLVGTNLSIVVSSSCATALFSRLNVADAALLTTLVMTPISFIFCQLFPKTVFRYKANRIVLYVAGAVRLSQKIFFPLVSFFSFIANAAARIVNPGGLKKNPFLTKDEIKSLIKDISREGILEAHEKEAIDKIFDLTLTRAADIMVPLKDVVSVDVSETVEAVKEKCRSSRLTRFPVFDGHALRGVVNIFDIFYMPDAAEGWRSFVRPVMRIEDTESLDKVFSRLQPSKEVMAAVFKGAEMVGILSMEDVMEEITSKLIAPKKV